MLFLRFIFIFNRLFVFVNVNMSAGICECQTLLIPLEAGVICHCKPPYVLKIELKSCIKTVHGFKCSVFFPVPKSIIRGYLVMCRGWNSRKTRVDRTTSWSCKPVLCSIIWFNVTLGDHVDNMGGRETQIFSLFSLILPSIDTAPGTWSRETVR